MCASFSPEVSGDGQVVLRTGQVYWKGTTEVAVSPTQRTLRALKEQGRKCGIVERFNAYVGPHGIRQDLFGIIDIIALDPERGVVGIQSTGSAFAEHERKILEENWQDTYDWLSTPGTALELWGWRKVKVKKGGKAMRWAPRVRTFTLADLGEHSLEMEVGSDGSREASRT